MSSSQLQIVGLAPAEKRALLAQLLKEKASKPKSFPLSYAQLRLWFLEQMTPGSAAYNVPTAMRLRGTLDIPALTRSLNEIIRRHESLRTTFSLIAGEPVQVIARGLVLPIPLVELNVSDAPEREAKLQSLIAEEAAEPFNLAQGPLLRAKLLRIEEADHVLVLTLHHIICDGWSLGVFTSELADLYAAYVSRQEPHLNQLTIQYADYARWQREWLQGEVLERQLSYWKKELAGAPAVLELPTDRPRPPMKTWPGAYRTFRISKEAAQGLTALSRTHGATLFMTLLAAFQSLLSRYSGQDDIVVGTPIAGRNRAETENLIGFFINTLVMRTDLSGDPTFVETLRRVREVALGAYEHQDVPFEKLVEELNPERSLSHSSLFQVSLILQNAPGARLQLPGLSLQTMEVESRTAKFDLTMSLAEDEQGLEGWLEYNTDLFEAATIERMISHFEVVVESVVSNPYLKLSELPVLTPAEREQMVVEWNETTSEYPREKCIHELFEEQVERTPEAVALVYGEDQVGYGELNDRANQLAQHLRGLGVGAEVLVGICMERSVELVVGLLGILKAGGAYVPLDPAYPHERLSFMLADCGAEILLTQKHLVQSVITDAKVICLDDADLNLNSVQTKPISSGISAENLAYVIYTSGSTGKPKGVMVSHGALVNYVWWAVREYDVTNGNGASLHSSVAFDLTITSLFCPLLAGRTVRLPLVPEGIETLSEALDGNDLSLIKLTPTHLHALNNLLPEDSLSGRARVLVIGGEALHAEMVATWRRNAPQTRIVNEYGPTEATVGCCVYEVKADDPRTGEVLIGRPIANTQIYILDAAMKVAPVGVKGELYVGGAGLARGYHGRGALTAERFVPDPYSREAGMRLYRTGDLARYREDGEIEYLGRIDNQVKVRGFRIELGEIESALNEHPDVRQSVVVVREESAGDRRLVAYVVRVGEVSVPELLGYLGEQLPTYMVPSTFVMLDELPLTPNGKVDRRALPTPDSVRPELQSSFLAPRSRVELLLTKIWCDVLRLSEVGIDDNFFALGGHSVLVMQAISRVRKTFQIEIPMRSLFEAPTVATLALRVESVLSTGQNLPAPPLVPVNRNKTLPLSFAQQRLWFLDQLEPDVAVYNVPVAVRMTGTLNIAALEQTFSEVVRRHEALRTTFAALDGIPTQVINEARALRMPVVDLSHLAEMERDSEAHRLITAEAQQPFDLARGPLLRLSLVRLGPEEHVLLCTMHHIVSDAWSMGVLVKEIKTLYTAYVEGQPSPLAELAIQYADYAEWQRKWLQGEVLEAQLFYWRRQLGESPEVLELPMARPRPAVQTFRAATQPLFLSKTMSDEFKALSQGEGTTLFITMLATFQTLLWHYTSQERVSVGTPSAGRDRVETEGLIGFFVNTLVMCTDLSGDPTFRQVMQRVKEVAWGAYAHQDVPFEKLVEDLHRARDLRWTPLFQVMFALSTTREDREAIELPGLRLSLLGGAAGVAKFDMTMWLDENSEGELAGALGYNADLFADSTMKRMSEHFQILLEAVIAKPDVRLSELQMLSGAEREQVLVEWNETAREYPREKCIHELFEEQVERTPEAVALVYGEEQIGYAELNRKANQLAEHLRELGVGTDVLVGICMERSVDLVVGLLGILKAGGAYVPLDPAYPKDRLAFLLQDADVKILLSHRRLLTGLPFQGIRIVAVDTDSEIISRASDENRPAMATPQKLAYMIYTSGSTGKPKGVLTQHSSLVNYIDSARVEFGLGPGDRVLQFAPVSFDAAAEEIYSCLTSGATLVLRNELMVSSVPAFLQSCRDLKLTVLDLPTAYWHHLTAELSLSSLALPKSLRLVIIGGEKALPERLATWQKLVDGRVRLVNTYGPTEATIVATKCDLSESLEESEGWREVSIGRPVANAQVYLLDRNSKPVPIGVTGELYIGGDGLARGYFKRPAATAEKFVPDQFSAAAGARLYRTGDLARFRADGKIEFMGRTDHQVKVRGFRVEVGEIEAVLLKEEAVREAIVIAREDLPGDRRLVAYVVSAPEKPRIVNELRKTLQAQLPEYMMPAAFVLLDALPLTPSGKIDRKALPAPERGRPGSGESHVAPRTPTEKRLVAIWTEILKHEQIGIHDNFFELGGHSLLATQMVLRVRDAFQIELPLRRLFESPTVAGLAEEVEKGRDSGIVFQTQVIAALPRAAHTMKRSSLGVQRKQQTKPPLEAASSDAFDSTTADERTFDTYDEDVFVFPASFAQQRLWFLDQLKSDTAVYNMPAAVRLTGQLDAVALEQTLNEITRRHEALRTTFTVIDEQPVQVITPVHSSPLLIVDLSELPEKEREAEALRLVAEEAQLPFNLAQGPLLRVSLLKLGEEEHVLLMTLHHIISDGWSVGVFIKEMKTLYAAFSNGETSPLPELPIQYADFAQWQREWLSGDVLDEQLVYWKQQLSGASAVLELPTDHPRPPVQTFRGAWQSLMLSRSLSDELTALSLKEGVTLFMTLLAAFQTLLYRYTGQKEIAVGTPIAGRTNAQTESLIGFFINTLVLSTRMHADSSFRQLMSQVREMALGAYAHQDVPFERLVEELHLARDMSRSPLFQVMMILQNASPGGGQFSGDLKLGSVGVESTTSKFDLTMSLSETGEGLMAIVEYNTDLFLPQTIQRMMKHFEVLLEGIVADPDQQLSQLPLLTSPERHQLLVDWNQTAADYPTHQCIHRLFEAQVELTPEATAVVCGEERLSYEELNRRANQLARWLQTQAVGPEVLVGVCMERSIEMVVTLLGILKAGGAYLPLDPSYPQARLSFMLEDATVSVVLTQARLAKNLPQSAAAVMRVDADWQQVAQLSVENPTSDVRAENLAYVIYTSGSTGQPKGVEIQHESLINLVTWHTRVYEVTPLDRATLLAGPAFDASVWELWPYLAVGASIHIPDQEIRVAAAKLVEWTAAESITISFLPTPLAEAVMATLDEQPLPGFALKKLLTGGDKLQRWPRTALPLNVTNHYGPTENTVVTTWSPVSARVDGGPAMPPIGRPIANTQVYILDEDRQPVPIGVAGELHIGGGGLARGYLKRPELTAERFIPNLFSPAAGARLYKTGDLASYLPDGNIEFRGRIDNQVKVRGFRIELGEIEAVLTEHPLVRESVVVARDDQPGEQRLVAYIVTKPEETIGIGELRGFIKEKLPEYMIPAAFVVLEELPLTPNGKIDRRALPVPGETALNHQQAFVAPRDSIELQLVQIWESLLGTSPIGVTDNFFELGGHSLIAVRLMSRIQDRFDRELPLATLFQQATIELLAQVLRHQQVTLPRSSLVEIRGGVATPLFFVHPVGGTVLCYQRLALLLSPDQAVYGLQARGLFTEEESGSRIEEMAADYVKALRVVQPNGPYLLGGHSVGGVIAFEMSQQLQKRGQEVALLALMDSWAPAHIPEQDDVMLLAQFAQELHLPISTDELLQRHPDEQLTYLLEQAQLAHALPPDLGIQQARRLFHVYKNNARAIRSYVPQLNQCRITLFRAAEQLTGTHDPASGWRSLTAQEMSIYDVPGNHFTMNREPHVRTLAERLQNCINQATTE